MKNLPKSGLFLFTFTLVDLQIFSGQNVKLHSLITVYSQYTDPAFFYMVSL